VLGGDDQLTIGGKEVGRVLDELFTLLVRRFGDRAGRQQNAGDAVSEAVGGVVCPE